MLINKYSISILQSSSALLREAVGAGFDLAAILAMIDQRINEVLPMTTAIPSEEKWKQCPSCGRGLLSPVVNGSGLQIVGCRLCRYSEVV